ncbi:MAG: hypothetical protein AAGE52_24945 [Myxococcota bacterium]
MRSLLLVLLLSVPALAQETRRGQPMREVRSRTEICPQRCQVLQRLRVGPAHAEVLREERGPRSTVMLFVRLGRRLFVETLGGDGPSFGGEAVTYSFDRLHAVEVDGDSATPEVVVLSSGRDPSATVCRLAPTPCCLHAMVAELGATGPVPPRFDGHGNLVSPHVAIELCDP